MPEPDPTYGQPPPIEFAQVSCTQCGYNLTGVSIGSACPECGTSVDSSLYAASGAPASGKAITSMVLGICSIVMCCCPGLILGIIGLVFGMMAMEDLKTGSFSSGSRSMAIAGLWCSGIGIALGLLYWLMQLLPLLFA